MTVAVAPLESKGRFDRLRPLELGIRDLITARLLELSGATSAGLADVAERRTPRQAPRFQVVQRSNMEQLLRELDLIQSGLSDKSRLPSRFRAGGGLFDSRRDRRTPGRRQVHRHRAGRNDSGRHPAGGGEV